MRFRRLLTIAGLCLAGVLLAGQVRQLLADPTVWPPDDFVEYWAAAHLTLDGKNPYDSEQLLPLQRAAGRDTDEAIMMWNPPWTLAVVLPLGAMEPRLAQLIWLGLNLAAILLCGDRLWMLLGGCRERRWIGWAAAMGFLPSLFALQSGQIPPLVLLGAVLFLECRQRGWPVLAGAATLLLAIKPHLAYLVWLAILCEAIAQRRFAVIAGGVFAGITATLIALAFDPHVLNQYADAMGNNPPSQWMTLTLGTVLRMIFGPELFRLQFVPLIFGLSWFALHWRKHGTTWNWGEQLPLLLLVSFITTPYGAWPFDMVLLLPAVMVLLVKVCDLTPQPPSLKGKGAMKAPPRFGEGLGRGSFVLFALATVNLACLVMNVCKTGSFAFIWVPPALLVMYIVGTRKPDLKTHPFAVAAA